MWNYLRSLSVLFIQLDELRKKVASLEEAIQAKDRENVTNRSMYDNMKRVSRNIKEVRTAFRKRSATGPPYHGPGPGT